MDNVFLKAQDYHDKAQHFNDQAATMRAMAATDEDEQYRKALMGVAVSYDRLATKMLEAAKKTIAGNF
jgi:hypothetical protein